MTPTPNTPEHQVSLDEGPNVITITVTAEDKTTELTYEVTVTRTPRSTDSSLSALGLKVGAERRDAEPDVLSRWVLTYSASVASTVTTVDLVLTAAAGESLDD